MDPNAIYKLFEISSPESQGFLLLKRRNFEELIKIIGPAALNQLARRLSYMPPEVEKDVPEWIKRSIKAIGSNQKKFAEENSLSESQFCRYLGGKGNLPKTDYDKTISVLVDKLKELNIISP